jgi:ubiquinone/menaquinone biosynthesis C-methylase UbiE
VQTESRNFAAEAFDTLDDLVESVLAWTNPGGSYYAELLRQARLDASARILDIGCGTGRLLARAARREPAAVLVGIDVDRDSIEIARERARSSPGPFELHLASAERMPFSTDYFDTVIAAFVLRDLRDVSKARVLREARRVLRPSGRILVLDWASSGCVAARITADFMSLIPLVGSGASGIHEMLVDSGFERLERVREYWTPLGRAVLVAASKP